MKKRFTAAAIIAVLAFSVYACSSGTETEQGSLSDGGAGDAGLFGSPWTDTMVSGNLPEKAPKAEDDLYTHYNYEILSEHQGELYAAFIQNETAVRDTALEVISDGSRNDSELTQLRIFYDQAADLETLKQEGISQLQVYFDRIDAAATVKELNHVLTSPDFPFDPWLYPMTGTYDMSGANNVCVYPNLLFVDNFEGAEYYQSSDDEAAQNAVNRFLEDSEALVKADLSWLGYEGSDADRKIKEMLDLERSYAKECYCSARLLNDEYGTEGLAAQKMTLEQLHSICGGEDSFPVRGLLVKFGKNISEAFWVQRPEWLTALDSVWTQSNLDLLKLMTKVKIIRECAPYLDPAPYDQIRAQNGEEPVSAEDHAIEACDNAEAFSLLISKIYVNEEYSDKELDRLNDVGEGIKESYRTLVNETGWLSDGSKEKIINKLDNMDVNILQPDGGYPDFGSLALTPSDQGGTLIGNYLKVREYLNNAENGQIGAAASSGLVWRSEMPSAVNCFYEHDTNSINIFPGFTSNFGYSDKMTEEELLGMIGTTIGHEISHGFDYLGSQHDANGTGSSIFTDEDLDTYLGITKKLVDYYGTIEYAPGHFADGEKVKVEAAADLTGLQAVLKYAESIKGFEYKDFFRSYALSNAYILPEADSVIMLSGIDIHPLAYMSVNVCAQMFDEFYEIYDAKEGDEMYLSPDQRIAFWGVTASN